MAEATDLRNLTRAAEIAAREVILYAADKVW